MMYKQSSLIIFFLTTFSLFGQLQKDSSKALSFANYISLVKQNHPYLNAVNVITKKANAELVISKSGFDPYLSYQAGSKQFIENYYQYANAEIKLPLWWGMDLQSGINYNTGPRLDNSETIGQTAYVGIQIPLLKNLIYDKRRAAVQQARIAQKQSVAEQTLETNAFLYDAILSYYRWAISLELYNNAEQILNNNQGRFSLVKNAARFGDRPAIDTLEQLTQLQTFELQKQNFLMDFINARFLMSAYLLDSSTLTQPEIVKSLPNNFNGNDSLLSQVEMLLINHPSIQQYQNKLAILKIDKKVKFQNLLPTLDVGFNILSKTTPSNIEFQENYIRSNNKYTIKAGIPLRLSEGRGSYKLAQLKVNEQSNLLDFKILELRSKLNMGANEMLNYRSQLRTLEVMVSNYQKLLSAEEQKFKLGESSLFLINNREIKLFEAMQKYAETKFKSIKAYYGFLKTAALLK
jgi:outer membrane protein TolC